MRKLLFQAVRFVGIGFLTTAVDFLVLNFLASLFRIYGGVGAGVLNVLAFAVAVLHSYVWNKNWAFKLQGGEKLADNVWKFAASASLGLAFLALVVGGSSSSQGTGFYLVLIAALALSEVFLWKKFRLIWPKKMFEANRELILFFAVSIVGTLINSGIVVLITSYVDPVFGLKAEPWLNVAKAAATGISLVWNFVGYKVLVFRR